ncbi:MAG TPA: hypothetical protein PLJ27_24130 [Polyangiaceae bacterium]|nr:MAG: hypothetical protein BWY17_02215 [Deltaproteobacteria bacterium ADurb.Bin207]HNS99136.1 hypothetical protein [Polyangiaceae bacterium]HNZ24356.1 hypothetical protein [Polyangiaceae bacterium]HOD22622.1 hypothetical protein [Polyangiaceae bacterium]HOE50434.1 hypothetical protein [Polyangiaceae bacterium]
MNSTRRVIDFSTESVMSLRENKAFENDRAPPASLVSALKFLPNPPMLRQAEVEPVEPAQTDRQ